MLLHAGLEQRGRHDRREGQGHDARDGHGAGQGEGELAEQGARQAALQADGRVDRGQGHGHGDERSDKLARAEDGRVQGRFALRQVPLHVLDHDDGVVDHESHGQDHGQQRQQVHGEAEDLHEKDRADEGQGDGDDRDGHGPEGPYEEEDDDDDDEQRVAQGLQHLMDGAVDVLRGVVGHPPLHARGQGLLDGLHFLAHELDDIDGVGVGQGPDADEHGRLAREAHLRAVVLGAQGHVGDVAESDDGAVFGADGQALEFLGGAQIRVGGEVDLDQLALGLPQRREIVVRGQGLVHGGGADVQGGHAVGLEPDAHGEGPCAEDVGALDSGQGRKPRLHNAHEEVRDLVLFQVGRSEAQVGRGELAVGRFDVDDGHLGLGRQVAAHLVDLGADLGQGLDGVVVELEADADGREILCALGLDVVDAVGAGDGPLQGRGDEPADQIGAGADIGRGHGDHGVVAARVLAHREAEHGLQPGDDDQQIDDQGQDRATDEDIGEFHGVGP
ncbi:hypothetical protein DSECCO2_436140 [anaerobic digester metagenome]